jgi:hypothetical protein
MAGNSSNGRKKIPGVNNGWFSESETMWPGQKFSLALEVRRESEGEQDLSIYIH